jgi:hypothetical protein
MKTVLDELRFDDDGNIDVRIIPPDEVSADPDILVTLSVNSQPWELVKESSLPRIAACLGVAKDGIVGLVDGGDDTYTIITADGKYLEVDVSEGEIEKALTEIVQEALKTLGLCKKRPTRNPRLSSRRSLHRR